MIGSRLRSVYRKHLSAESARRVPMRHGDTHDGHGDGHDDRPDSWWGRWGWLIRRLAFLAILSFIGILAWGPVATFALALQYIENEHARSHLHMELNEAKREIYDLEAELAACADQRDAEYWRKIAESNANMLGTAERLYTQCRQELDAGIYWEGGYYYRGW